MPWTQMRYYNYRFGAKEDGEVWLSVIPRQGADAVLLNVNRWYNQFRLPEIVTLEDLKQEPMLGVTGYLVEAEGAYHAGMGADPRPETRMLAAAIPISSIIVTIKMIGSPAASTTVEPGVPVTRPISSPPSNERLEMSRPRTTAAMRRRRRGC